MQYFELQIPRITQRDSLEPTMDFALCCWSIKVIVILLWLQLPVSGWAFPCVHANAI